MTPDALGSLVRQILTAVLSTTAAASFVSNDQAVAIASGLGTLATVIWSIYAHWNQKKVPSDATVIGGSK